MSASGRIARGRPLVPAQRRHLIPITTIHARRYRGALGRAWRDDARAHDAERVGGCGIARVRLAQRCRESEVEISATTAAGPVTLRAVGMQVGPRAIVELAGAVGIQQRRQGRGVLVDGRRDGSDTAVRP